MNTTQQPDPAYDIVILGASGFTGKYVVREALKFLQTPSSPLKTLALAGRNPTRLTQSLQWAAHPNPPPSSVAILTADTSDPDSLRRLCTQTKLILNCVGPFRIHGDPVVAACADSGCDYLDISGEPEFMERMDAKYHERAEETGSLIVSACGFDSIPAELGLFFNSKQWEPPSVPNHIQAYLSLESDKKIAINFGTYESAVLIVANSGDLKQLRRSRPRRPRSSIHGPPAKGAILENQKKIGLWALKLPSADAVVVRRTLTTLTEKPHGLPGINESPEQIQKREAFWSTIKPAHFGVKITSKSLFGIFRYVILGVSLGLFAKFSLGRWLLLKFPSLFSLGMFQKKGPSEEEVESATFKMWFIGRGYSEESLAAEGKIKPDMEIITRISGPEVGYITTPIALVQCGLIVLGQRESLVKGGVYTPGIVFGSTDIQQRLEENGISFEVISKNKIQV
ncbi:unnamed protein product [Microthlaspi erraticum]|uniref:Saccharopine dehydrogenase NADP binding domain-containing protein n=1 Tax=Microthlaspi erraticum TaxID=1685480 RepID=A0A6D2L6B0_9BRAS|nr:unnamed protein product [Microthlaspi erraticum]